jgi:hypothetical protein
MAYDPFRYGGLFKGGLFLLALSLMLLMYFYIQRAVVDLRNESREIMDIYANIYARIPSASSDEFDFLFDEIVRKTQFPIVQTGIDGSVKIWKGIGIDPLDTTPETIRRVENIVKRMDREAEPIPLMAEDIHLGYLHYGDTQVIKNLGIFPYLQVIGFGLFVVIGIVGFNNIRRSEQRYIWVGMAKEMAHQLGTPISSLMGWSEILKSKHKDSERVYQTVGEMEHDITRLSKVAGRFSRIGSKPELNCESLELIARDVADYFRKRLPQLGKEVDIDIRIADDVPDLFLNRDLFEWVLENLIKNALDAIERPTGSITISAQRDTTWNKVYLDIQDTGKGIHRKHQKDIFKPGYSTKKRGWGLGLSLAKRIIEEYHGARLVIKESQSGVGTTMRMILPI